MGVECGLDELPGPIVPLPSAAAARVSSELSMFTISDPWFHPQLETVALRVIGPLRFSPCGVLRLLPSALSFTFFRLQEEH